MKRQVTPTRSVRVRKDTNLKLIKDRQRVARIKKQRAAQRLKVKKQQARDKTRSNQQEGKAQTKLTDRQQRRRQKSIKRNIAKNKKLKYKRTGGDIAFRDELKDTKNWQTNFTSSNVWKFKIRGNNLMVSFLDGSVYLYFGAAKLFLGMTQAGSKGKYVHKKLIEKGVAYTKIR